eukprot:CAMPEP_0113297570 /NCGR_PEP_ID=MMETSP0010_2-20120614/373_1 /TAXON_ID=216773 ORGANISM="Corethron hystrix, Strain 308" /NCGR_SAMPLE_ID=MMETSP0010_2 /ASSEMBLY_ACC=CAM_ASM_000155 /LENGTH=97 /DNA_ID=CAMNT_0000150473 /DNA_START=208 /DNA_END=501 /DNA_ORIENTATION=+ /assembly_acc=CAM_ASM_000155
MRRAVNPATLYQQNNDPDRGQFSPNLYDTSGAPRHQTDCSRKVQIQEFRASGGERNEGPRREARESLSRDEDAWYAAKETVLAQAGVDALLFDDQKP